MSGFGFLTEEEIVALKKIASGVYGGVPDTIAAPGGWNGNSLDLSGTFCSRSCPGSPFRRLIDMGLVIEYRQESRRIFGWKSRIAKDGIALLDRLDAKLADEEGTGR